MTDCNEAPVPDPVIEAAAEASECRVRPVLRWDVAIAPQPVNWCARHQARVTDRGFCPVATARAQRVFAAALEWFRC